MKFLSKSQRLEINYFQNVVVPNGKWIVNPLHDKRFPQQFRGFDSLTR
jgi:hypothetical protein